MLIAKVWLEGTLNVTSPMKSVPHTGVDRAVDLFLDQSRLATSMGLIHQVVDDDDFHGGTIHLGGREVANFGLCSYLALGDDPRLKKAAIDAVTSYGNSYSSSVAYTSLPLYGRLKGRLETMIGAPVVIAGTTTLAHLAALPVLIRGGDTVLVDAYAHASLLLVIPSIEAGGARVRKIAHNDLDAVVEQCRQTSGRVWYVMDGLYSMHGDTAPAEEIARMLEEHDSLWVYCDDAHGLGWAGENGRGQYLDRAGWHDRLVMSFGLAKSFGTMGGVIASKNESLLEAIEYTGGPMVFGGPLPPPVLGASIASADIHLSDEIYELQSDLLWRIDLVNELASDMELSVATSERTPLWFVEIGPVRTAMTVAAAMAKEGFYVNLAGFPVVPRGRGGVRFTVTRYNTATDIEGMLSCLRDSVLEYGGPDDIVDLTVLEDEEVRPRTER